MQDEQAAQEQAEQPIEQPPTQTPEEIAQGELEGARGLLADIQTVQGRVMAAIHFAEENEGHFSNMHRRAMEAMPPNYDGMQITHSAFNAGVIAGFDVAFQVAVNAMKQMGYDLPPPEERVPEQAEFVKQLLGNAG